MTALHVHLDGPARTARVLLAGPGQQAVVLPPTEGGSGDDLRSFRTLPELVSHVVRDAAGVLNLWRADDDARPDVTELAARVARGSVHLHLHGPDRELAVCGLYLRAEYGLGPDAAGLHMESIADAPSVYSTYGVDAVVAPLEDLARDTRRVNAALEATGGRPLDPTEDGGRWKRLLDERVLNLGVTGDTGVGKSTFINAMLHEINLLPTSSDVCTAVVSRVGYAPSAKAEGFTLNPHSDETRLVRLRSVAEEAQHISTKLGAPRNHQLEERLTSPFWSSMLYDQGFRKQLETKGTRLLSRATHAGAEEGEFDEHAAVLQKLEALEHASIELDRLKRNGAPLRFELDRLREFVHVSRTDALGNVVPNGWPDLLARIDVDLHHPLLRHLRVLDTPGMRDQHPGRAQAALDAATTFDGWLYLVGMEGKANTSTLEPIDDLRERAHVRSGIVVATKADLLVASVDRTQHSPPGVEQLSRQRRAAYASTGLPVVQCAPKAAIGVPRAPGEPSTVKLVLSEWQTKSWGWPLIRGRVPEVPIPGPDHDGEDDDDRLSSLIKALKRQPDVHWGALRDLQVELSEIVPTVRGVLKEIEDNVVRGLVAERRRRLRTRLAAWRDRCRELRDSLERQRMADDLVGAMRREIEQATKRLKGIRALSRRRRKAVQDLSRRLAAQRDALLEELRDEGAGRQRRLADKIRARFSKDYGQFYQVYGKRIVLLRTEFRDPMVKTANTLLDRMGESCRALSQSRHWLNVEDIHAILARETSNFSLDDEALGHVQDFERLLELRSTVLERAQREANRVGAQIVRQLEMKLQARLDAIASAVATKADEDGVQNLEHDARQHEEHLKTLRRQVSDAEQGVLGSRAWIDKELEQYVGFLATLDGLLEDWD